MKFLYLLIFPIVFILRAMHMFLFPFLYASKHKRKYQVTGKDENNLYGRKIEVD